MVWFWIITIVVGLVIGGHLISLAASRKGDKILKNMERQYEQIIDVLLANAYLKENRFDEHDQAETTHNCMQMLKPHVDSLLAHINATDNSDVKISFPTKYFANVASFADSLFYKRSKHREHPLTREDEEKMYAALRDALQADIMKRQLYLEVGRSGL